MKRLVIAAVLLSSALSAGTASAQYYGDRPPPPPDEDYAPPPPRPGYGRPAPYDYDRPRSSYGRHRPSFTCVTSRGVCPTGRPMPHGAPCACDIPGFGYKRGATD